MKLAPIPPGDEARIAAVHGLGLIGAPPHERFDRLARVAARTFDVPMAFVSLVDADTQVKAACVGMEYGEVSDRSTSFCGHALVEDGMLVVLDAREDDRFVDNPHVVADPPIIFYAGHPLTDPLTGERVGTLCLADSVPRTFTERDRRTLAELAAWAESELGTLHLERLSADADANRVALHRILDSAAEGIFSVTPEGIVTAVNASGAAMLGWEPDELIGRSLHEVAHHRHADGTSYDAADCPTHRTAVDGRHRRLTDDTYWHRDGHAVPVESSATPMLVDGEPRGTVLTLLDVSSRRAAEQARRDVLASVSHDLRTPLTSIAGALGLLEAGLGGGLSERGRDLVEVGSRNVDRLLRLIDDLLVLERADAGVVTITPRPVAVSEVVQGALDAVRMLAEDRGIRVISSPGEDRLLADPDRVVQVLVNLLGNALKFSPDGSTIRLDASAEGGEVVMTVADEGRGIPPDRLTTILGRYTQVEDLDANRGTGLGLAIARTLVEAHGGRISVDSAVGSGSTFTVRLPRYGGRGPAAGGAPTAERTSDGEDSPGR